MSLAKYFERNRPMPKFFIGDKVFGYYDGVLIRGTVGNDRMVSDEEGSVVSVHLHLPLIVDGEVRSILQFKQDELKLSKIS